MSIALLAQRVGAVAVAGTIMAAVSIDTASATELSRYVTARVPVAGRGMEVGAFRPAGLSPRADAMTPAGHPANSWSKLANLPGAVVHDVAFQNATVGYAAAELGQVWKTTDGGNSWKLILNRSFPYYYYGINVMGPVVMASGFDDNNSEAILSISTNGGAKWAADIVLSTSAWAGRVRMTNRASKGLAMNGEGLANPGPNAAWWTTTRTNWTQVTPDPNGGWFGYQFTLLNDQTAYASGITFCKSANIGATWNCAPSADQVFDGPTQFLNDKIGWTGGGEISPNVAGWLHRTTDGGTKWSGRVLNTAWPIRQIEFLSKKVGWAAGGNIYSNVGGIYYSADGGKTWAQDLSTTDEIGACAHAKLGSGSQTQVWCVGDAYSNNAFSSNVYSAVVATP